MKKISLSCFIAVVALCVFSGCSPKQPEKDYTWLKQGIETAALQLKFTVAEIGDSIRLPRSIWTDFLCRQLDKKQLTGKDSARLKPIHDNLGSRRYCFSIYDWTSGFFPGNLWLAYQLTGDESLRESAVKFTNYLYPLREYKGTHDIGFMMNCSYGNANRLSPADSVRSALIQTADNLCGRFNPEIGCIRSWNFGKWNFPVIIDNMMNLDLLFNVYKLTGDEKYKNVAVRHAQTTMKNHFRPDYTSYHVVSYNNDGSVEIKQTHQGKNAESAWSRGQAWGVYGYTSCYRETRDTAFLQEAVHIADMIMERVKTDDLIPYWDYDAPAGEKTPRDASAAAVTASAFLELSTFVPDGKKYSDYAETILKNLSGTKYLAAIKVTC